MQTFKDASGNVWDVSINVGSIKFIKEALGIDLLDIISGEDKKLVHTLITDPLLLVDMLYCICKRQADALNVSDTDFGQMFDGDMIETATDAFIEELIAFFPKARRGALTKAIAKVKEVEALGMQEIEKKLDTIHAKDLLDRALAEVLQDSTFGDLSTKAPQS